MINSNSVHLKSNGIHGNYIRECIKGHNEQLLFCIYKLLRIQQQLVKWRGFTEGIFIYSVISFEVFITKLPSLHCQQSLRGCFAAVLLAMLHITRIQIQVVLLLLLCRQMSVQSQLWFFPEKEMATYSTILAQRIPWTEEPGGLLSVGLHNSRTLLK